MSLIRAVRDNPYSISLDKKLYGLRKSQESSDILAHTIWECINVLIIAIQKGVGDLEYEIYFELVERKAQEYGLANHVIESMPIGKHLESLRYYINKKTSYLA
jgi:hypothetical protein